MTERLRNRYIGQLYDSADALYEANVPDLTEEKFALFETVGNRLEYEHVYFERRRFLTTFGCTVLLGTNERESDLRHDTQGEKYRTKLELIIADICDEECWALPAHVNRKDDPGWRITVDLFAAETAQALAELYAGLKGVLPEQLRSSIRAEVMRRVIEPYAAKEPYAWWEQSDMNWNAVCNGSIGMAALDLLDDEPELQEKLVRRVLANLEFFLNGFAEDGACLEGLGYFTYGFYYYMGFMDLLARKAEKDAVLRELLNEVAAGGIKNERENLILRSVMPEKCRKIVEFQQKCYFPSGLSVSFSDGSKHEKYRIGLTCKLAMLYDTVEIPDISCAANFDFDPCYRFLMASRDLMWSEEYSRHVYDSCSAGGDPEGETDLNLKDERYRTETEELAATTTENGSYRMYVLPAAQWAICRGTSGGGFAIKGGHNAEPHNHNDVGNFIYALGDEPLLTDLGAGEYTAQYFKDETRYDYICCSSLGHNVPVINGRGQQAGREFACGEFSCHALCDVRLSFAGAYGEPALKRLTRSLKYEPETEILTIEDVFDSEGCLIEENLVTQGDVEIENGAIFIYSESPGQAFSGEGYRDMECRGKDADYSCRIISENGFPDLKITEELFMNHDGNPETVKRITWKAADISQTGKIACRFRIEPVR
ncbi:MAG: heparinase II/III family protein [Lachnospiraceae bacterium]|nr:heparinase II/III family protein [Lachnospiraceae bacterium]